MGHDSFFHVSYTTEINSVTIINTKINLMSKKNSAHGIIKN